MKRTELNISTGESVEITVTAYKSNDGELLLLDDGVIAPAGYVAINDEEAAELSKPKPTQEEIVQSYIAHMQQRLDDFARTRGYDGVLSCCTYATSKVTKFAAEAQYMVNARDLTWSTGYQVLAEVSAGTRPVPTLDELDAQLPALAWPA